MMIVDDDESYERGFYSEGKQMKITRARLRQLINEEVSKAIHKASTPATRN